MQNLAENWSRARDINGRDRDETETLTTFVEARPRRDTDTSRDRLETETTTRLLSVMNAAARLICSARKCDHITPLLQDLHWLCVPLRIEFKLAVLAFRCLHGMAVPYLARELRRVADMDSRWRLRSASTFKLNILTTRRVTVADRAFGVAAAHVWNSLPSDVTASPSLSVFKRRLKTSLFSRSFDIWLNCLTLLLLIFFVVKCSRSFLDCMAL